MALLLAVTACNNAPKNVSITVSPTEVTLVEPATPAGTMEVVIKDRDKDTSSVTFHFTIDTIKYERTYKDLPLVKDFPDTAIYRVFWDKPNSVWIGFIKPNRDTRYYHASQDGRQLKVLWVPSPPGRIYTYMEKTLGLGDVIRQQPRVKHYEKNLQSGTIIDNFVVTLKPGATKGFNTVYIKFGGVERNLDMEVPEGTFPYIQPYNADHVIVGLEVQGELEEIYEIKVVNGRIGYKQIKQVIN